MDKNDLELWPERFDGMEKRGQLGGAVAQAAGLCDLTGKFTGETEAGWSDFDPTTDAICSRGSMKR